PGAVREYTEQHDPYANDADRPWPHDLLRSPRRDYRRSETSMTPVRFAVDTMLGRLATWLRLIGQDATYGAHLSGLALIRHARRERRVVLTRDRQLLRQPPQTGLLFIEADHFRDQLRQVVTAFNLDPFRSIFTRCARCNTVVVPVPASTVQELVPQYVFATQQRFV